MNKTKTSEEFLQLILSGVNPNTGELLSSESPLQNNDLLKEIREFLRENNRDWIIVTAEDKLRIEKSDLFEKLRKKRLEIANEIGWKPYHILSNEALYRIIIYQPKTLEDASHLKHIGEKNIEYVPPFLEIINSSSRIKTDVEKRITRKYIAPSDTLCISCKSEIDFNRRMAEPDCLRCLQCQTNYEKTHDIKTKAGDFGGTPEDIARMKKQLSDEILSRHR